LRTLGAGMGRIGGIFWAAVWMAVFVLSSGPASGQVLVSVHGNVGDPTGSAVQNATVHLINSASNADRTTSTDQSGNYDYPDVAPGTYRLRVEAPGFEPYEQDEIQLQGNAPATVDVKMKVSQVQQTVRVTAEPGDQCLTAKGRILPEVGPGLRAIRSGPSGNYYVLTSPGSSAAIYSADGKRIGQVPGSSPAAATAAASAATAASSAPSTLAARSAGSSIVSGADLEVDSNGRVYVADLAANAIKIYSAEGTLIRAIRVPAPVSVEPLPGGEVAVSSLSSKHLVDVYDEERGEVYRSFGDTEKPVMVQCDSITLSCTAPAKDTRPTATTSHFWFYGDGEGNVYVSLADSADPTIRKYDAYGYVAYESALPLSASSRPGSGLVDSSWSLNANVRVASAAKPGTTGDGSQSSTGVSPGPGTGATSSSNANAPGGGGAGVHSGEGATQDGLRIVQKVAGGLPSKAVIEAMGVDPASQEVWVSVAGNLVHFDKDGQLQGHYCLSTTDQAAIKPTTILVEPNRILIGSDPFGVFEYARPDK
jgi:hypothetical protein